MSARSNLSPLYSYGLNIQVSQAFGFGYFPPVISFSQHGFFRPYMLSFNNPENNFKIKENSMVLFLALITLKAVPL